MKQLMIILDGLQDHGYPQLEGKTPQEAGGGEALRRLEGESATVRLATTPTGLEPDTLICTLTLLGLSREELPAGRSCLEALAEEVPVGKEDLVLRCNFVRVEDGKLEVPCCTPPEEIAQALMAEVSQRHQASLKRIGGYKCLQSMKGAKDGLHGLKTFPPHNYASGIFTDLLPQGNQLGEELAETSRVLLDKYHPYTVLHWAPSIYEELPAFEARWGKAGGMVTKTLVLEGVAKAMEMSCPALEGATGDTDTNLVSKRKATLSLLEEKDFVMLHVGGTDEATHRQNPVEKAEFIARVDRELLVPVLEGCPVGTRVMLTCDHTALCSTAGHTEEPVTAWLWEKGAVHKGDMGLVSGEHALELLGQKEWPR